MTTTSIIEEVIIEPTCEDREKSSGFCAFWSSQVSLKNVMSCFSFSYKFKCSTPIVSELCKLTCGVCRTGKNKIDLCADKASSPFCNSWAGQVTFININYFLTHCDFIAYYELICKKLQ